MKQVTIIGSGNAFNTDGRAHAAYLLEHSGGEILLMDCGATTLYRLQAERFDANRLSGLLLTHFHGDHFGGLPFLLLQLDLVCRRQDAFVILGPPGVEAACRQLIDLCYPAFGFHFALEFIEVLSETSFRGFDIQAFPIHHRPESAGYRVSGPAGRTIAFSGDSAWDEALFDLVRGVDLALVELTMEKQSEPPVDHVAWDQVEREGHRLEAKRIVFTHIYDDLERRVLKSNFGAVARDGLTFTL
ncbi:MAG: MBL fold metallo-hydrolase [Spirochaetales bacterium]|nr:MBL fold metallo-hydrolase [Leptospiraceae bacterium]MCP5480670.1 MBL fold metallo-hydrolase [Spirochaetales bacterium]MCP5484022.1 MBL fold metallo-hydrolase [Spirochaetales bacterium]